MQQAPMNDTASAGAVYVQTNAAPNEVIAFRRAGDGSLDRIGNVATGGDGAGSPHLQSQGSVALTRDGRHLLVTNAASDDLSVFSVAADGSIELRDRVHTGATPKSVAEHDGLVVVLNTGKPGLASFRLDAEGIAPVVGGDQALAASDADPAQVAFSPEGSMIVITERGTDSIVTYAVAADGTFGASHEIPSEGPTPYGFAFTSGGTLVVTEAFRGRWSGARCDSSRSTRSPSPRRKPGAWRSPQTPASKDAASCWPRGAPPGACRPATARPTSLGSGPTRRSCPSSEGCSRPTMVPRSYSSGRGSRCSPTLACYGCSAASCIRPMPPATVG
jgi:6-phosphogluconolactonase (cycloisomerase 2 family)